jgi:predicted regulator of Ras-like GTPase activity (Roadblock/LC7/MglB family)
MTEASISGGLSWLLENLATSVDHVRQAIVLSADGLTMGSSPGLGQDDADHLAALAAGVQSLARGAGRHFHGGYVRQTIIEMDSALLFITAAGQGACLAVLADADADADAGLIAYEMTVLVKRVGQHLAANPRFPGQSTTAG